MRASRKLLNKSQNNNLTDYLLLNFILYFLRGMPSLIFVFVIIKIKLIMYKKTLYLNRKGSILFVYILIVTIYCACTPTSKTEKKQTMNNNITSVKELIKEINIEDVLIGSTARLFLLDNYLLIADIKSKDKLLHLFEKGSFRYVTSTASRGQGPGEITNIGHIGIDNHNLIFYASDHGKQKIFQYNLDSVLRDPSYKPDIKVNMAKNQFPATYYYLNDTLCIARLIEPTGNSGYNESIVRWNMQTGAIKEMKYTHPDIEKKRVTFTVSEANNLYVECYSYHHLMTICDLNGELKFNVYGPDWKDSKTSRTHYYGGVEVCKNKIIASFSGGNNQSEEYYPTRFLIFDLDGNYLQTLDIGRKIVDFCYDREMDRIIMNLNDEIQFAYLNLDELLN